MQIALVWYFWSNVYAFAWPSWQVQPSSLLKSCHVFFEWSKQRNVMIINKVVVIHLINWWIQTRSLTRNRRRCSFWLHHPLYMYEARRIIYNMTFYVYCPLSWCLLKRGFASSVRSIPGSSVSSQLLQTENTSWANSLARSVCNNTAFLTRAFLAIAVVYEFAFTDNALF